MDVVLLGPRPSSAASAEAFASLFGSFISTMAQSDPSKTYMSGSWISHLPGPVCSRRRSGGLPVLVHIVSWRAGVFDYAEPSGHSRVTRLASVAFPLTEKGRHSDCSFSQLNGPPASTSVYASLCPRGIQARLKAEMESLLLSRRALTSPTMCRFIPALSVPEKDPEKAVQGLSPETANV